jgi:hypothetical protein
MVVEQKNIISALIAFLILQMRPCSHIGVSTTSGEPNANYGENYTLLAMISAG